MPNSFDPVLEQLVATVTEVTTVVDSAIVFISGLREQFALAMQAAMDAGATPAQLQTFADLDASLDAKAASLAEAIAAL